MQTFFQGVDGKSEHQAAAATGILEGQSSDRPVGEDAPPASEPAAPADPSAELRARLERLESERESERESLARERAQLEAARESVLQEQRSREYQARQAAEYQYRQQQMANYLQPPQINYEEALTDPKALAQALGAAQEFGYRRSAIEIQQLREQIQNAQAVVPHVTRSAMEWAYNRAREMERAEGVPPEDFDAAWGETAKLLTTDAMRMNPEVIAQANAMARKSMGRHLPSKSKAKVEPSVPVSGRSPAASGKQSGRLDPAVAAAEKRWGVKMSDETKEVLARRIAAAEAGAL